VSGALEAVDRILNRGGQPDDVLRDVLEALVERGATDWAGVAFLEDGRPVLGPSLGAARPDEIETRRIELGGGFVGELWTAPGGDRAVLDRVAVVVAPYVRVDPGGAT
jgi:hypothetical protein